MGSGPGGIVTEVVIATDVMVGHSGPLFRADMHILLLLATSTADRS